MGRHRPFDQVEIDGPRSSPSSDARQREEALDGAELTRGLTEGASGRRRGDEGGRGGSGRREDALRSAGGARER
jgi:hypothetical protein